MVILAEQLGCHRCVGRSFTKIFDGRATLVQCGGRKTLER